MTLAFFVSSFFGFNRTRKEKKQQSNVLAIAPDPIHLHKPMIIALKLATRPYLTDQTEGVVLPFCLAIAQITNEKHQPIE